MVRGPRRSPATGVGGGEEGADSIAGGAAYAEDISGHSGGGALAPVEFTARLVAAARPGLRPGGQACRAERARAAVLEADDWNVGPGLPIGA